MCTGEETVVVVGVGGGRVCFGVERAVSLVAGRCTFKPMTTQVLIPALSDLEDVSSIETHTCIYVCTCVAHSLLRSFMTWRV